MVIEKYNLRDRNILCKKDSVKCYSIFLKIMIIYKRARIFEFFFYNLSNDRLRGKK